MKRIPYGKQYLDNDDIQSVVDVLNSDWLTCGPTVREFEQRLCDYTGAKYAVVVSSGTAALHLAILSLGLSGKWEGITSPNTFLASANAIIYGGGKPVFADISEDTYNINHSEIDKQINSNTKVIIPVDFAGHPADMKEIYDIAKKNGLFIIRDACHSIGSSYMGQKTGGCLYSDMTIFSFHPVKHITTGEGGAILTNNKKFYDKLIRLRNHGIVRNNDAFRFKNQWPWYYEMQDLGYNYRITDIQCALGLSQLKKLDAFVKRRREIVSIYNKVFSGIDEVKIPTEKENVFSSYHLYVLLIDFVGIGINRVEFMEKLKEKGILTQVHYIPVHLQPYYRDNFGYRDGNYPVAEEYYQKAISLPLYPSMTDEDVEYVIKCLREIIC